MNQITINADLGKHSISRHIYGHFSEHLGRCIYGGFWVGEDSHIPNTRGMRNDVVAALKAIHIPNLRWPGGCFADEYHWMDGIGPKSKRPTMINTHWGGVTENNHFGTHEFFDLCEQLDTEPYICGNVGRNGSNISPLTVSARWLICAEKMGERSRGSSAFGAWAMRIGAAVATCAHNIMPTNIAAMPPICATLAKPSSTRSPVARTMATMNGPKS